MQNTFEDDAVSRQILILLFGMLAFVFAKANALNVTIAILDVIPLITAIIPLAVYQLLHRHLPIGFSEVRKTGAWVWIGSLVFLIVLNVFSTTERILNELYLLFDLDASLYGLVVSTIVSGMAVFGVLVLKLANAQSALFVLFANSLFIFVFVFEFGYW